MKMQRWVRNVVLALVIATPAFAAGCEAPGVGDPCEPEQVPEGGFVDSEAYLETSSVQCRTRVCLVYKIQGDPRESCRDDPDCTAPPEQEVEDKIFCTCRCDAPGDSTATLCECPDGFSCKEILNSEKAGSGIRGSYCVRDAALEDDAPEDG